MYVGSGSGTEALLTLLQRSKAYSLQTAEVIVLQLAEPVLEKEIQREGAPLIPAPPKRLDSKRELNDFMSMRSKWPVWHVPVLVSVLKEAVRDCFGAASALKEAFRACCSRSLFTKAGLGCTVL